MLYFIVLCQYLLNFYFYIPMCLYYFILDYFPKLTQLMIINFTSLRTPAEIIRTHLRYYFCGNLRQELVLAECRLYIFKNQQAFNLKISNFLEIVVQQIMKAQVSESNVANFVQKAFEIISNNQYSKIIQWSANGKEFTIKDIEQFQETILPKYFRHRNINSFIRQLNMYGFHKSRKEPTKNIFSHPFFQKDKPQLLSDVKRKIKLEENETPKKSPEPDRSQEKITIYDKPTAQKEQARLVSNTSLAFKSSINLEKQFNSPVKGLISRSLIMDINPEVCLRLRENPVVADEQNEEDDVLSIADEIIRQRQRFNNRTQGISIVRTSNFIEEFQF